MDVKEIIEKVKEKYSSNDILEMLDNEILDWNYGYDEDDIEEWDSRWDFYQEYNNGEAENAVVDNILLEFNTSRNKLFEQLTDKDETYLLIFEEWLSDYTSHNFNV